MNKYLTLLLSFLCLPACSNGNDQKLEVMKNCKQDISGMFFNDILLNDLLLCSRKKDALEIIDKNESKFTVENYSSVGEMLFFHGNIDESIKYLETASNNNDGNAQQILGEIYLYSNKYKNINKAIEYFKKSLINNFSFSNLNLADIYLVEESHKNLILSNFFSDRAIDYGHYEGYYYKAKILAEQGEYDEAIINLDELKKHDLENYYYLGLSEIISHYGDYKYYNPKKAKKILEDLLKTSNSSQKFRWLADFYMLDTEFYNKNTALIYYKKAKEDGDLLSEEIIEHWK